MLDETINTDINEIILNAKGGFSADDSENELENKTEVPLIKTHEELKLIVSEIEKEVVTEVEAELVQQNQGEIEPKELTEEEKHAKFIEAIKQSHLRYHPKKHFGTAYKQKRKAKNRAAKKSRKNNR